MARTASIGKRIGSLTLFTVDDLSMALGVPVSTVRTLLRSGKLHGRKIAKRWYVTEDNLRAFFANADEYTDTDGLEDSDGDGD